MTGQGASPHASDVRLRDVIDDDLPILYEHQLDPEAAKMAAFPSRERDAFMAHWARIRENERSINKTILADGRVAGSIAGFDQAGKRLVGYWVGREFWGRGVATRALAAFLENERTRPLYAYVAKHNIGSLRVLQKCGFVVIDDDSELPNPHGDDVEEFLLELRG